MYQLLSASRLITKTTATSLHWLVEPLQATRSLRLPRLHKVAALLSVDNCFPESSVMCLYFNLPPGVSYHISVCLEIPSPRVPRKAFSSLSPGPSQGCLLLGSSMPAGFLSV